jgi:hypothetical protein
MVAVNPVMCQTLRYNALQPEDPLQTNHEVIMGEIRARARRAGTKRVSQPEQDRLYLLGEVDRLARVMVDIEREADRQVEDRLAHLHGRIKTLELEKESARADAVAYREQRDASVASYESLAASISHLVNSSEDFTVADRMRLQAAMAHRVKQVEEACAERVNEALQSQMFADEQIAEAMNVAEREKDIRRRVHERFKRVRRDAVAASYEIKRLRRLLETEQDLGLQARKFAALANRVLEAEKEEDAGAEPTWP